MSHDILHASKNCHSNVSIVGIKDTNIVIERNCLPGPDINEAQSDITKAFCLIRFFTIF